MIVVEDIEASEIHRFVVIDSSIQLGIVRAGTYIRTFDPERAFSYYNMVENQLHDFAAQYPGAFKYLPRRAYDYLKKPQLLSEFTHGASELSQSSWLADFLVVNPLIGFCDTVILVVVKCSVKRKFSLPQHTTTLILLRRIRPFQPRKQGFMRRAP